MTTLRLMLDQEMKNLENLKQTSGNNRNEIARAEATIAKLNEQLKQMCGEVRTKFILYYLPRFLYAMNLSMCNAVWLGFHYSFYTI